MSRPLGAVRASLAVLLCVLPVIGLVVAALLLGPRLGARIASHWSGPGPADGFSSTWGAFWTFAAITAALAIGAAVSAIFAARQKVTRNLPAIVAAVAGFTACAWVLPAWATADAVVLSEARLGARMLVMLTAVALGAAIYLLLPPTVLPLSDSPRQPSLPLGDHERISWTGIIGSRMLEVVAALVGLILLGTIVLAVVLREGGAWIAVAAVGLATLLALAITPARLTVDRRGIRLTSVLLRFPLIAVKLENIESVTADSIDPMRWGGWGYRLSGAGLAYVIRRGPGLIIGRRGGNGVAITVDDPQKPAAVANALLAQAANRGAKAR